MVRRKTGEQTGRRRAVIFDFDGTIADSFDYVYEFLKREANNTRAFTEAEQQAMRKMSMKRLALHLGIAPWRLPAIYFKGRRVMRTHMEHVEIFPGMDAAIRELHEAGCRLFVVSSNSRKNIHHLLRRYALDDYFTALRSGAGYMGKASLVRQLLAQYRLPKNTTWYVGDETSDVVAATAAGLSCIAVGWGFADPAKLRLLEPAAFAGKPSDIPDLLEAAWKK